MLSCKAGRTDGRPPRRRRNHFSQFIISRLFPLIDTQRCWSVPSPGGWTIRSFCHTFPAICHVSSFCPAPSQERVIHVAARGECRDALPPACRRRRLRPTWQFFRVTAGTRPCEAVTDWTPRVTRVMMRAQHACLNGIVLEDHLGATPAQHKDLFEHKP